MLVTGLGTVTAASGATAPKRPPCRKLFSQPQGLVVQCDMARPSAFLVVTAFKGHPLLQIDVKIGGRDIVVPVSLRRSPNELIVDARHHIGLDRLLRRATRCQLFLTARAPSGERLDMRFAISYKQR